MGGMMNKGQIIGVIILYLSCTSCDKYFSSAISSRGGFKFNGKKNTQKVIAGNIENSSALIIPDEYQGVANNLQISGGIGVVNEINTYLLNIEGSTLAIGPATNVSLLENIPHEDKILPKVQLRLAINSASITNQDSNNLVVYYHIKTDDGPKIGVIPPSHLTREDNFLLFNLPGVGNFQAAFLGTALTESVLLKSHNADIMSAAQAKEMKEPSFEELKASYNENQKAITILRNFSLDEGSLSYCLLIVDGNQLVPWDLRSQLTIDAQTSPIAATVEIGSLTSQALMAELECMDNIGRVYSSGWTQDLLGLSQVLMAERSFYQTKSIKRFLLTKEMVLANPLTLSINSNFFPFYTVQSYTPLRFDITTFSSLLPGDMSFSSSLVYGDNQLSITLLNGEDSYRSSTSITLRDFTLLSPIPNESQASSEFIGGITSTSTIVRTADGHTLTSGFYVPIYH